MRSNTHPFFLYFTFMKQIVTISLLLIITTIKLSAQNYFPFKLNEKRYYFGYGPDAHYTLIATDSSVNQQPKTYTFAPTINPVYIDVLRRRDCEANGMNSILGSQVKNYGDTLFEFINFLSKPTSIYLNTPVGLSWTAYSDSNALAVFKHDSTIYSQVNGEMDSVQCFSIVVTDLYGDLMIPLEYQLRIGLKTGFIQFPNLYTFPLFPFFSERVAPYEFYLANTEIHNITWDSIYNFNKGDEMHTHYVYYTRDVYNNRPPITDTLKTTLEILGNKVVFNADSIGYLTKRTQYSSEFINEVYTSNFSSDTIWMNFKRFTTFDIEPTLHTKSIYLSQSVLKDQHGLYKFNHIQAELQGSDSCFSHIYDMGYPEQYYYYNGLSGPYFEKPFYRGSMYEDHKFNKLVYYKKGNKTWGVPISKTVGIDEANKNDLAKIYPNPANDILTISLIQTKDAELILTDVLGKVQYNQKLTSAQTQIDVSQLAKGIYYYIIISLKGNNTGKLIIQ